MAKPNPECKTCGGSGLIYHRDPATGYEWTEACGCVK